MAVQTRPEVGEPPPVPCRSAELTQKHGNAKLIPKT